LIKLFTGQVGQWSYIIITIAAVAVMFSTTITVFDGYSRALSESTKLLLANFRIIPGYSFFLLITATGGLLVVLYFSQQIKQLVDLATLVSFVIAPVVAVLNFKLVNSNLLEKRAKPTLMLNIWAFIGIVFLAVFTMAYAIVSIS
jgi:Mn2+/Fe2+ NRAMP family transporter